MLPAGKRTISQSLLRRGFNYFPCGLTSFSNTSSQNTNSIIKSTKQAPLCTSAFRVPSVARSFKSSPFLFSRRNFASGATVNGNVGDIVAFPLADIGEGITECEIMQWFVKPGDTISQFAKVCEVQSDKATVEITSRYDGVIQELKYNVGQMAIVGKPLMMIKLTTATGKPTGSSPAASTSSSSSTNSPSTPASLPSSSSSSEKEQAKNDRVLASPSVRRLAREKGIDLSYVSGSGSKNQITKEDLMTHSPSGSGVPVTSVQSGAPAAAVSAPASSSDGKAGKPKAPLSPMPVRAGSLVKDVEVPVSGIQRIMVKSMTAASAIPAFGYSDEICMDELVKLRKQIVPMASQYGVKLSYFAFILKATSLSLTKFPMMNAHVNADCTITTMRGAHNIGLAMDTPRGLLVPNIKNVQDLSILQIGAELQRLQELGKAAKLGKDDLSGGTFTLSNIGTIGGTYCRPILVVPEVAIGALGKFHVVPRIDKEGKVVASTVMHIGWTADHRVLDGATVARFSNQWKEYLENPVTMGLF